MLDAKKCKIYLVGQFELSEVGRTYVQEKILPELRKLSSVDVLKDALVYPEHMSDLVSLSGSAKKSFLRHQENLKKADLVLVFISSREDCSPDPETAWALGFAFANGKPCIGCRDSLGGGHPALTDSIALSSLNIVKDLNKFSFHVKEFLIACGYSTE